LGVASGDFSTLCALFAEDGSLEFQGLNQGPFHGRSAISEAFKQTPPDDELMWGDIVDVDEAGVSGCAAYGWRSHSNRRGGMICITIGLGGISKVLVIVQSAPLRT
jgi:hypothetical protein